MTKCQSWCLLLAGSWNQFRSTCIFPQRLTQCQNSYGMRHDLLEDLSSAHCSARCFLHKAQETILSLWPPASTQKPGGHRDSGKTTSHLTGGSHVTTAYISTSAAGTQPATEHLLVRALDLQQQTKIYKSSMSWEIKDTTGGLDLCRHKLASPPSIPTYTFQCWQAQHWHQI